MRDGDWLNDNVDYNFVRRDLAAICLGFPFPPRSSVRSPRPAKVVPTRGGWDGAERGGLLRGRDAQALPRGDRRPERLALAA